MDSPLLFSLTGGVSPAVLASIIIIVVSIAIIQPPIIVRPLHTLISRIYIIAVLSLKQFQKTSSTTDSTVVTGIYLYPVKSLRTVPAEKLIIDTKGFVGDRRYMLVTPAPKPIYGDFLPNDPTHRFLTQRQCPILARLVVTANDNQLEFSYDLDKTKKPTVCVIPMQPNYDAPIYKSTLWGDVVTVQDMGDDIAEYIQTFIKLDTSIPDEMKDMNVRLVIQHPTDQRKANDKYVPSATRSLLFGTNPRVHLGDGFPILIASEASLKELNRRLNEKGKESLPMSRFRPNIVIQGTEPFIEDKMKIIQVGDAILYVVSSCPRCKESCTDQTTGIVTTEPVETMKEFRAVATKYPENVYFAVNAIPAPSSIGKSIHCGDTVHVLEWGSPVYSEG